MSTKPFVVPLVVLFRLSAVRVLTLDFANKKKTLDSWGDKGIRFFFNLHLLFLGSIHTFQLTQVSTTVSSTQTEDQETKSEDSITAPSTDLNSSAGKIDEPPVLESSDETGPKTCNCEAKYNRQIAEQKERLEKAHREDKQKALDEQSERVSRNCWVCLRVQPSLKWFLDAHLQNFVLEMVIRIKKSMTWSFQKLIIKQP